MMSSIFTALYRSPFSLKSQKQEGVKMRMREGSEPKSFPNFLTFCATPKTVQSVPALNLCLKMGSHALMNHKLKGQ
ncbi:hypothetical protein FGO68_gene13740 [Halteria grandinella]|uniref:Uncharacterized protein n=1 Tax=Halteria grandinella TaxID=5974 RepID=A0A8J8NZZ4_HALGN|nr:hypothetical protein FGO68_gene13740 [Halteria grandinella]